MKRVLYKNLLQWKNDTNRKPLLLQGARQVGKTYLVNEFAKREYKQSVYLNFEQDLSLRTLFSSSLQAKNILENISLYIGKNIEPENTLIFFDEVQVCPEAIKSLKYFYEQAQEYHIIAAGSLLGVSVGMHKSFPVGKVNFLTLYPMNFYEYLLALNENLLAEKLMSIKNVQPLPEALHIKLINMYKKFLFLGGMPEVLKSFLNTNDIALSRKIQKEILEAYQRDFSKYTERKDSVKISEVWKSIPYQLAKENKKFKYKEVSKRGRASSYEQIIQWLSNAGLINIAYNTGTPKMPLLGYVNYSKFKTYLHDTGLLAAMLNLSSNIILQPNALFQEYNGAFIENFTACEFVSNGNKDLVYWTSKSDAEVDFIFQYKGEIFPVEVKSGMNKNIKSLRSYSEKYKPKLLVRTSPRNFIRDKDFINIPLYAISGINKIIENNL